MTRVNSYSASKNASCWWYLINNVIFNQKTKVKIINWQNCVFRRHEHYCICIAVILTVSFLIQIGVLLHVLFLDCHLNVISLSIFYCLAQPLSNLPTTEQLKGLLQGHLSGANGREVRAAFSFSQLKFITLVQGTEPASLTLSPMPPPHSGQACQSVGYSLLNNRNTSPNPPLSVQ